MNRKLLLLCATLGLSGSYLSAASEQLKVDPVLPEEIVFSDTFQKQLAYSFAPNTEIEPQLKALDADFFTNTVNPLLSGDTKSFNAAIAVLEEKMAQEGENVNAIVPNLLGNLYYAMANEENVSQAQQDAYYKKAKSSFIKATKLFPNYRRAFKQLAQVAQVTGDAKISEQAAAKAIKLGLVDSVNYAILGFNYFETKQWATAEIAFRNAIMLDPDNMGYMELLGSCLNQQERYKEANAIFEELIQRNPDKKAYWQQQTNSYVGMGLADKALQNIEVLRLMGMADAQTLNLLGDIYAQKNMVNLAYEAYMQALSKSLDESHVDIDKFVNEAYTLNAYGSFDDSIKLCDAIEKNYSKKLNKENKINLSTIRSAAFLQLGDKEGAVKNLQDILAIDSMNQLALLTLAGHYAEIVTTVDEDGTTIEKPRNRDKAINLYVRGENSTEKSLRAKSYKAHGQLFVSIKDYESALDMFEESLSIDPSDTTLQKYADRVRVVVNQIQMK